MVKKEKDIFKEVFLVVLSGNEEGEVVVIDLKGSFKESDLASIIARN
jgi:hypothetical protein